MKTLVLEGPKLVAWIGGAIAMAVSLWMGRPDRTRGWWWLAITVCGLSLVVQLLLILFIVLYVII